MPIYRKTRNRADGTQVVWYQLQLERKDALEGFRRIRRDRPTEQEAKDLLEEITKAIDKFGKWPVQPGDQPRAPVTPRRSGTLREAALLALESHWKGTAYEHNVTTIVWSLVVFFETHGKVDIDDIVTADVEAYIAARRAKGCTSTTINKHLSALSVIGKLAMERRPPLSVSGLPPLKRLKRMAIEKWWLRPEDQKTAREFLHEQGEFLFADYIDMVAFQGLRVEEALRLRPRHFTGLSSDKPLLKVPGTKTSGSERSIPVYRHSLELVARCLMRAEKNGYEFLFPMRWRHAAEKWERVRALLGVSDNPTATLRALRRTFAWYANDLGMPTKDLQRVLRHSTIVTTDGYLQLVGGADAENSRKYMDREPDPKPSTTSTDLEAAIMAYRKSGATPAEVAIFVKELMQ